LVNKYGKFIPKRDINIETVRKFNDFMKMLWTDKEMERVTEERMIYLLSTRIFDNSDSMRNILACLAKINSNFPEYTNLAIDGYLDGRHDT